MWQEDKMHGKGYLMIFIYSDFKLINPLFLQECVSYLVVTSMKVLSKKENWIKVI